MASVRECVIEGSRKIAKKLQKQETAKLSKFSFPVENGKARVC